VKRGERVRKFLYVSVKKKRKDEESLPLPNRSWSAKEMRDVHRRKEEPDKIMGGSKPGKVGFSMGCGGGAPGKDCGGGRSETILPQRREKIEFETRFGRCGGGRKRKGHYR